MPAPVRRRELRRERQNQMRHDSREAGREPRRVDQREIRRHRHHRHRRAETAHMITISFRRGNMSPSGTNANMPSAIPACVHIGR